MEEKVEIKEEGKTVKKGRRKKNDVKVYELNKSQTKFFVDLSKEKKELKEVQELLVRANNKEFGSEITFKELSVYALKKLTQKDIEKIQENTLSEMEKVERHRLEYNNKNNCNLSLGEFLVKKLNIN